MNYAINDWNYGEDSFWHRRERYLRDIAKATQLYRRLIKAGKGKKRWPRNAGDMFYNNYLDAEATIFYQELLKGVH